MKNTIESNVVYYSNLYSENFVKANESYLYTSGGERYLDFLSGCGSINYGHNNSVMKQKLLDFISADGLTHSLDFKTPARSHFLEVFDSHILKPRNLNYRIQFTGPTGTNAVEAAIKLARKITGRKHVISFTNGFHGVTLGSLALTGNKGHRSSSINNICDGFKALFDGYLGDGIDTADILEKLIDDPSSGVEAPAAFIFEPIQGEGGQNTATEKWAKKIANIAKKNGTLLIVDEIQCGCGRSGDFFAFEHLKIVPDIIVLAKAISGFGIPMSLVLINPELDQWEPGEHNGTFRGNCHAFVTAAAAIEAFWNQNSLSDEIKYKTNSIREQLTPTLRKYGLRLKGRGLMLGIELPSGELARQTQTLCRQQKLIVETSGPHDEVLKLLPTLTISDNDLMTGLEIINSSVDKTLSLSATKYQSWAAG